ncbi:unnamed protein product [Schistosoma mattheei]|uniref:Uncharacterized protein n=1 Tax=Schistosoma mattheei TaxID=31246 RepID=A0A3P8GC82_9TREM|nr:unnamed protein product [Schistosoma mattheei]
MQQHLLQVTHEQFDNEISLEKDFLHLDQVPNECMYIRSQDRLITEQKSELINALLFKF